jgi:hypothetical protein
MSHLICLSTGLVYKLENDRNKMIEMLKVYELDGIEINFPFPDYLLDYVPTNKNIKYLNSLKFVSIHLPWANIGYGPNAEAKRIVTKIRQLSKRIRINNLVIHPLQIEDFQFLNKFKLNVSIENEDPKMPKFFIPEDFKQIFDKYSKLYFNFDFAHARLVSKKNVSDFIESYQDKIIEIHLSSLKKGDNDHWFLKPSDSEKNRAQIKKLKQIKNAAIVFECVARDHKDLEKTSEEIKYIRELLD